MQKKSKLSLVFNPDDINQLCGCIDLLTSQNSVNQSVINKIVGSLNNMYINNCRSTFGTVSSNKETSSTKTSSWFNKHCKSARKKINTAKHQYKLRKNHETKRNLSICSKEYKKALCQEQTKYKNTKIKELRKLKRAEPRKFWKFLNDNKKSEINLILDKAHEYFSKFSTYEKYV